MIHIIASRIKELKMSDMVKIGDKVRIVTMPEGVVVETKIDKYEVMLDEYHTCIVYDVKYKDVIMSVSGVTYSWISYQTFESNETAVAVSRLIEERKIVPFSVTQVRKN